MVRTKKADGTIIFPFIFFCFLFFTRNNQCHHVSLEHTPLLETANPTTPDVTTWSPINNGFTTFTASSLAHLFFFLRNNGDRKAPALQSERHHWSITLGACVCALQRTTNNSTKPGRRMDLQSLKRTFAVVRLRQTK